MMTTLRAVKWGSRSLSGLIRLVIYKQSAIPNIVYPVPLPAFRSSPPSLTVAIQSLSAQSQTTSSFELLTFHRMRAEIRTAPSGDITYTEL